MAFYNLSNSDDPNNDPGEAMRKAMGPLVVDNQIRQAINMCWVMMPPAQRTPDAVEARIRYIVDRALRDMRDERSAMGS